jgi:hypothetical protein
MQARSSQCGIKIGEFGIDLIEAVVHGSGEGCRPLLDVGVVVAIGSSSLWIPCNKHDVGGTLGAAMVEVAAVA